MTVKNSSPMKKFRALVTVEFEAPDRTTAVARAKEMFDTPNSKVRVQEASVAWLTLPDAPTS
jgi:hypothetical protein